MAKAEKGLIKKLLTKGLLAGTLFFNSFNTNAQFSLLTTEALLEPYYRTKSENINYISKYNTLVHKMLMIEDSGIAGSYPSLKNLDEAIDLSKKFIKKTRYTKQELSELSKKIYSTINSIDYSLAHNDDEAPLFRGNLSPCYIYSLYYLAIGQANNLPFYAVNFEKKIIEGSAEFIFGGSLGHMFIRYDKDGKHDALNSNNPVNRGDVNIETTVGEIENGKEYSDKYYINKYSIPEISLKNKISLVNLNERKLLGIAYNWRASKILVYANKMKRHAGDELNEEVKDCDKLPKDPLYGYGILATKEQKKECLEKKNIEFRKDSINNEHIKLINESFKYFDKAIELNPNSFIAYYCKGAGYESLSNKNSDSETDKNFLLKSIENYIKAVEISPSPWIYRTIAFHYSSLEKEGCYKDIEYITKAINLTKENIKKEKNLNLGYAERIPEVRYLEEVTGKNYLEEMLKILERNKEVIEESAKYKFKRCDKISNY